MDGRTGPNQYAFQTPSKLWLGWGSSECESRIEVMVLRGEGSVRVCGVDQELKVWFCTNLKKPEDHCPVNAHLISGPTVSTKTIK